MKVTMETYGGFAAGVRRPARVLDAASLSTEERRELDELIRAARAAPAPSGGTAERVRDGMSYAITIDDGTTSVLEQGDGAASEAFAALRRWLQQHT